MKTGKAVVLALACLPLGAVQGKSAPQQALKKLLKKEPQPSPLDVYVEEAYRRAAGPEGASPGSLWSPPGMLGDLAIDLRARTVDDMVTIVVNEQASAVSTGATKTSRASSASSSVTQLAGILPAAGRLANLANVNSSTSLNGQGTTSRQTTLTTTVTARVTHVLPNGYLVIEGSRAVLVNSENQVVTIRGVVRPADLGYGNTVQSSNVAQMELKINGRGVVNDSIRRPNILYRILLGLLPF
ncbi:MAG TPA: flagellar basal body L-ring protein FlgH [Bryobacteraceae bacterium]